jgi:hypothetical protein
MKDEFSPDLTRDEIHDRVEWLKSQARKGSDRLHATAAHFAKPVHLTNAESAAIARAKIEKSQP